MDMLDFGHVDAIKIPYNGSPVNVKRILDKQGRVVWQKDENLYPFYIEATAGSKYYVGGVINETSSTESKTLNFQYSFDNTNWTNSHTTIYRSKMRPDVYTVLTIPTGGNRIYFRATTNAWHGPSLLYTWRFVFMKQGGGACSVGGNIMSLLYGSDFVGKTQFPSNDGYEFYGLFDNDLGVRYADKLLLPATTVNEYGYCNMFSGCSTLMSAPTIQATTIKKAGCSFMFETCTSLTEVPDIPATTLNESALSDMFRGCTRLVKAPNIAATTLKNTTGSGYGPMTRMFMDCTSLTTPPERLDGMVQYGFDSMFRGCTSLEKSPYLPNKVLAVECYSNMFMDCSNLREVRCNATDVSASGCTLSWLMRTAASGTFYKNSLMNSWPSGTSGIPSGWTVRNL